MIDESRSSLYLYIGEILFFLKNTKMKTLFLLLTLLITLVANSQCNRYYIYESFSTTLPTQQGTWINTSVLYGTTSSLTRTGNNYLTFNAVNDAIRLPLVANPGVLSFYFRRSSTSTGTPKFVVQTSTDGTAWTDRLTLTTFTTTYVLASVDLGALSLTNIHIRIIDLRVSGGAERYIEDLSLTSTVTSENTLIPILGACSQTLNSSTTYTVTDNGGPVSAGGYSNSLNRTVTFTPSDNTKKLNLNFTQMSLETTYDYLYIYDGATTSATLLGTFDGTTIPSDITATNVAGELTIKWTTDISNTGIWGGFSFNVTSITVCTTPTDGGTLSVDKDTTTVNDAVELTTTGNGGTITKIEWSYNNFSTVAGSSDNPVNPFSANLNVQQNSVYFKTTSKDGTCPIGTSNIVEVYLYSAPVYTNGVVDGDYISNVTLGNITNTSTNDGDSYENFTSQIIELSLGEPYSLSITSTNTLAPGQGYVAWIDYNGDGTFQTTENIMQKAPANSSSQLFTVPSDATTGDVKMRVLSVWNATPNINAYYATPYGYGEIEEYTVRLSSPQPLPVELTQFEGTPYPQWNVIKWTTASEQNSSHFDLELSTDGENWRKITTKTASGNSTEDVKYSYIDYNLNSLTYYRLQQHDIDGIFKTYGPISVTKTITNKKIIKYINLLGQEVNPYYTKGLIIEIYDDGSTRKMIR